MVTADSDDTAPPRTPNGGAGQDWRPRPDPTVLTTAALREAIGALRELVESRLDGMDRATELLAETVNKVPSETDKAIGAQQREMLAQVSGLRELLESRLSAMDKATELLAATVGKVPSDTDKAVDALRQLLGARIDGMDTATKLLAQSVEKFPTDIDRVADSTREYLTGQIKQVEAVALEKFAAIDGTFASNALALTAALAAQKEAAAEQNKSNTLAITKSELSTKETISANAAQTQTGFNSLSATVADIKDRVVRIESAGVGASGERAERRLDTGQLVTFALLVVAVLSLIVLYATKK